MGVDDIATQLLWHRIDRHLKAYYLFICQLVMHTQLHIVVCSILSAHIIQQNYQYWYTP